MANFDLTTAKDFRVEFNEAVKALNEKFNCNIKMGKISVGQNDMSFKVEVTAKTVNGKSFEQNEWEKNCYLFDLKAEWFGKLVVIQGKSFKITKLNVSKPKNCVTIEQIVNGKLTGKLYNTSSGTVRGYFRNIIEL